MRIVLRADSGFANDELMAWCEANRVDLRVWPGAQSPPGGSAGPTACRRPSAAVSASGQPARVFCDFRYRTLDSWSRSRRVVGKAEHTLDSANPRFVVTSLKRSRPPTMRARLYEDLYCARGEAENRIGEQFELFADRASSATMQANQLRMWFSAMAYVLVDTLAPRRPAPQPVRRCRRRHHSAQAAQARRTGAHQRAPHSLRHRFGMPEQG